MLMNSREICKSLQCAPQFARVSQPHIPLRSGLPLAVRGASAVRSGLPSGVRGTPGVGYSSHCADAATGSAAITNAARDIRRALTGMAGSSWRRMLSQEPAHRRARALHDTRAERTLFPPLRVWLQFWPAIEEGPQSSPLAAQSAY